MGFVQMGCSRRGGMLVRHGVQHGTAALVSPSRPACCSPSPHGAAHPRAERGRRSQERTAGLHQPGDVRREFVRGAPPRRAVLRDCLLQRCGRLHDRERADEAGVAAQRVHAARRRFALAACEIGAGRHHHPGRWMKSPSRPMNMSPLPRRCIARSRSMPGSAGNRRQPRQAPLLRSAPATRAGALARRPAWLRQRPRAQADHLPAGRGRRARPAADCSITQRISLRHLLQVHRAGG